MRKENFKTYVRKFVSSLIYVWHVLQILFQNQVLGGMKFSRTKFYYVEESCNILVLASTMYGVVFKKYD